MDRYDAIELVARYLPAVGRLVRPAAATPSSTSDVALGTCIVVARSAPNKAVLLTTSYAVASRKEAAEAEAIFHDTRVLGSGIKQLPMKPVRLKLRPERLFFTSAPDSVARMPFDARRLHAESVGYTVVGCDVEGADPGSSISALVPISLPWIRSKIPAISVGDSHLVVGYRDGLERCMKIYDVDESFSGHSSYVSPLIENVAFESGGVVFDRLGEFVGLHHEAGGDNHCIHIASVVEHLYYSLVIGRIGVPVVAADPEAHDVRPREHDGSLLGTDFATQRKVLRTRGDPIEDHAEIEYRRITAKFPVRETLIIRNDVEVWAELYQDETYESLVLMLHAFHDHPRMLKRIIDQLASRRHREDMARLARLGGIGILLEAIVSLPYDEDLMTAGATLVGRVSLHSDNQEALSKYSGVQAILSVAQEYRNTSAVAQWCIYTLMNLCEADCAQSKENIATVVGYSGLRTVLWILDRFPAERHVTRWGCLLVASLVHNNKANFDLALDSNACTVLDRALKQHADDEFVLFGVMLAVWRMMEQHEMFFAAADYFFKVGLARTMRAFLDRHCNAEEPALLVRGVFALECLLVVIPEAIEECIAEDTETALSRVAAAHMTDAKLHLGIHRVLRLMGVDDPVAAHPHLQVGAALQ